MRATATDFVAWSVWVSVCLLVTFVSPAKTAESIEMPKEPFITGVPTLLVTKISRTFQDPRSMFTTLSYASDV